MKNLESTCLNLISIRFKHFVTLKQLGFGLKNRPNNKEELGNRDEGRGNGVSVDGFVNKSKHT